MVQWRWVRETGVAEKSRGVPDGMHMHEQQTSTCVTGWLFVVEMRCGLDRMMGSHW
jgi:hypothetical protein